MYRTLESLNICSDPSGDLVTDAGAIEEGLKDARESGNIVYISLMYSSKAFFLCSAGEYEKGLKILDERASIITGMNGSIFEGFFMYVEGLFSFGSARFEKDAVKRKALIARGKRAMKPLKKLAMQNPESCLSRLTLLEAEYAALSRKNSLAKQKYSQAIAMAIGNRNSYETIFAKQFAGFHLYMDLDDHITGVKYLEDAVALCIENGYNAAATIWGGKIVKIKEQPRFFPLSIHKKKTRN
jgi:hypothetical protein